MIAYTVSLGSDMLQMTKICFWHLFLRDSGLIYFQLPAVEPVRYLKSSGKTKVTKVRFFRKNLIFRGWISLEKCPFLLQISFLCQFTHLFGCLLQPGLIDHCQNWYIYNWHVLKCNYGAHFASVLYDSKSRKLKLKKWRREKGRSETTICGPTTSENFSWSFALDYMFKNLYLIR